MIQHHRATTSTSKNMVITDSIIELLISRRSDPEQNEQAETADHQRITHTQEIPAIPPCLRQ